MKTAEETLLSIDSRLAQLVELLSAERPAAKRSTRTPWIEHVTIDEPDTEEGALTQNLAIEDVRAALAIVTAREGHAAAIALFKKATGVATLPELRPEKYGDLFKAALPSGRIAIEDVRAVLVKANERVANSGVRVLNDYGAKTIGELTPDKFVRVILAAEKIK